jgi:hypothetical protein
MNMHAISSLTSLATLTAREPSFYRHMSRLVGPLAKSFSKSRAGQALGADAMAKRREVLPMTGTMLEEFDKGSERTKEMIAASSVFW